MIFKNHITLIYKSCFIGFWSFCISCSDNPVFIENKEGNTPVKIGAAIDGVKTTRSYQEYGDIETGEFYLSYIDLNSQIKISPVNFTNGIGEIKIDDTNSLEWKDIGYNSDSKTVSTFYLDNVPNNRGQQTGNTVTFTSDFNPFVAGVLDVENGENDLLWGSRQIARNSPIVNFQLHHCMSMLNIELTVEKESDVLLEQDLDVENVTVSISNVLQEPKSYDRMTGILDFALDESTQKPSPSQYKSLTLVNKNNEWKDKQVKEIDGTEVTVYKSKDFVLPPQDLLTDDNRPRLSLSFPTSDESTVVYSGVIPRAMEVRQPDGSTIPMTLSFLREYCLTLHVRLSLNPVEIIFMPVTVVDWVNKGSALLTADQAGVNDEGAFLGLLEIILNNETSKFERYGYKDSRNGNWVFNIFTELTFDLSDENLAGMNLRGILKDRDIKEFSFSMHHWKIIIIDEDGHEHVISTSDELVSFLVNGVMP